MDKNRNKGGGGGSPPGGRGDISDPPRDITVRISQPFTVRQESTSEDNQRHADQKDNREATLRTAQRLNWITFVGAIVSVLSLVAVFLTLKQTDRNFRSGQRAWVLVGKMALSDKDGNYFDFSSERPTPIVFTIKNFGLSPALHVWSETDGKLSGGHCDDTPSIVRKSPYMTYSTIGPGAFESYPNYGMGPLPQPCLNSLHDGSATYKVSGELHYRDIFGKEHITEVCSQYEGLGSRNMTTCENHTDAN